MKLIFISIIFVTFAFGGSGKTDVYFTNGILVKKYSRDKCEKDIAAECSQNKLEMKLKQYTFSDGKNFLDPSLVDSNGKHGVMLVYNWHKGTAYDLLETYYQLKESGQIERALGFFGWLAEIGIGLVQDILSLPGIVPSEEEIREIEQKNVDEMVSIYKKESVDEGDDILLFSHSQGNLFANRMYDVYFSKDPGDHYKYRFANIQVADPADYVHAYTHDYITRDDDSVMALVPGSLDPNVHVPGTDGEEKCYGDGDNHAFIRAYIECPATFSRIKKAVENFHDGKNGDGGDMPSGGCSYNPHAKHFDVMLVLMSLLTVLYPLYHGARWIRRRYG